MNSSLKSLKFIIVCLALHVSCSTVKSTLDVLYAINIRSPQTRFVEVNMVIGSVRTPRLILMPHSQDEFLRLTRFRAYGESKDSLDIQKTTTIQKIGDSKFHFTKFVIHTNGNERISVTYRVEPGALEGKATKLRMIRYGYLFRNFALLSGKNLFVVPDHAYSIRSLKVFFRTSQNLKVVTPWRKEGEAYVLKGNLARENLLNATLAFGNFNVKTWRIDHTELNVFVSHQFREDVKKELFVKSKYLFVYFSRLFNTSKLKTYNIVLVPKSSDNRDIFIPAWSYSQGASMSQYGKTMQRWREIARNIFDIWNSFPPTKVIEYKNKRDLWFKYASRDFFSYDVLSHIHLIDWPVLLDLLYQDYVKDWIKRSNFLVGNNNPNFLEPTPKGILLMYLLNEAIKKRTAGKSNLFKFVRYLSKKKIIVDLLRSLNMFTNSDFNLFFKNYVYGNKKLLPDLGSYSKFMRLEVNREPKSFGVIDNNSRRIVILHTGYSKGFLEKSGCKINQTGGIAKRATVLENERQKIGNIVLLDVTNSFPINESLALGIDTFTRRKLLTFLKAMEKIKYDAAAIGTSELAFGPVFFKKITGNIDFPYLSANIFSGKNLIGQPYIIKKLSGIKIAILGLSQKPIYLGYKAIPFEDNIENIRWEDPIRCAQRYVTHLRKKSNLLVIIGELSPLLIRKMVKTVNGIDLIISSNSRFPRVVYQHGADKTFLLNDDNGFIDSTLVIYSFYGRYGVSKLTLKLNSSNKIIDFSDDYIELKDSIPDSPRIRKLLNGFYNMVRSNSSLHE